MTWHAWAARRTSCLPTSLDASNSPPLRLDLNGADHAALRQLPGVGDATAARVLAYRLEHGPFHNIDELRHVSGIGPKLIERLRPLLEVTAGVSDDSPGTGATLPHEERTPPRQAGKKTSPAEPIDVNVASVEELQRLPGIGPSLAERIIQSRAERLFRSVEDLRRVRGIGPKILASLRPHVLVKAPQPAGGK
jgi:competence protein ComEA